MTPTPTLRIMVGDALAKLRELADESVQCCVTSPPYWGLRDYGTAQWEGGDPECDHRGRSQTSDASTLGEWKNGGGWRYKEETGGMPFAHECGKCGARRVDGQLGLERTPGEYVAKMVEIFREVRRVLRKDGTLWLNLGDSYASDFKGSGGPSKKQLSNAGSFHIGSQRLNHGLKPKDLVGIPWRCAFALQADGWWLRSDIIWAKLNPMPESCTDRCTKAHEYMFLLTKSERYFYDAEAIKEPQAPGTFERYKPGERIPSFNKEGGSDRKTQQFANSTPVAILESGRNKRSVWTVADEHALRDWLHANAPDVLEQFRQECRSKRDVWPVATAPYPEAHFATYPPDLIKPCILAGTSAKGCCPKCGAPWERVVERGEPDLEHQRACGGDSKGEYFGTARKDYASAKAQNASETKARILAGMTKTKTTGWKPTCGCGNFGAKGSKWKGEDAQSSGHRILKNMSAARAEGRDHDNPFPPKVTTGWKESCDCNEPPVPCAVLDPFAGSGTTGEAALELGRSAILIELSPTYAELIDRRCTVTPGLALA